MKNMKFAMKALSAAIVALLVTACGSGTSKSNDNQYTGEPPRNPAPTDLLAVEFSNQNFVGVAGQTLKSVLLNDAGSNALNRAVTITTDQNRQIADRVTGIMLTLDAYPCANGGNFKLKATVNNAQKNSSTGDIKLDVNGQLDMSINATFNTCNQNGNYLDGDVSLLFTANVNQLINGSQFNLESHLVVDGLAVEQPNLPSFVFDGEFDYNVRTDDGVMVVMDIFSNNTIYFADETYQLLDFNLNKTVNNQTQEYSYHITSEFTDSSDPTSFISYETVNPLRGVGFSLPTSGQLSIAGSNGTVLIHALADQRLLLQLDLGGDGSVEEEYYSTWEDLVLNAFDVQF